MCDFKYKTNLTASVIAKVKNRNIFSANLYVLCDTALSGSAVSQRTQRTAKIAK